MSYVLKAVTPIEQREGKPNVSWFFSRLLEAVVDIIAVGMRRGVEGIEFAQAKNARSLVFDLHDQIARLPKPDTTRFDNKHPYFSAHQTIHGASIELCVLLLHWQSKDPTSEIGRAPREALSHQPELRDIFERTLKDASTIGRFGRVIFGRYLGSLCYFGEEWTRQQLPNLFPANDKELREAAWIAHIQSDSGPVGTLSDELIPYYAEHIASLSDKDSSDGVASNNRLSEYLMVLYLWDKLPEDVLQQFWQFSPASLRRHAMSFMGRQLAGSIEEHKIRAISYWERRLSLAIEANDPEPYRKELATIGQWFLWKVDESWLMDQLLVMLNAGFAPNDGLGILDKLAEHIPGQINQVVEITKALVKRREMDSWILVSQAEALRRILIDGKQSDSPITRESVQQIISFLSSRGNTSFLDLV